MAQHWSEGVGTLRFTSREYQQELIEIGRTENLLACPPEQAANFIALKLLQEMAYQIRPPSRRKSVYLTLAHKLKSREIELCQLTDLHVASFSGHKHVHHLPTNDESVPAFVCKDEQCLCCDSRYLASKRKFIESNQVLIMVSSVLDDMLEGGLLEMSQINLIIIEECHSVISDKHLQKIMAVYMEHKNKVLDAENTPRIIAFTYPLFTQNSLFDYNNLDSVTANIQKDYDDFINHRSEFYHQWDSDGFNFDQSEESNLNTPVKSSSPCYSQRNEKSGLSTCNRESANEALSTFMEPVILEGEENEDFQKMTDFNYWKMDIPSFFDVPELGKKIPRLSIYDKLEYQLEKLEAMLGCKVDMSPDIVGLKKITGKPREVLLESQSENADDYLCSKGKMLKHFMKVTAFNALVFLEDHRYDPLEIYGDDAFGDELRAIPDPLIEPKELLLQFLHVLDQAGPYAADKAAFVLLIKIEKLKVKTPYERHFLLLCLVTSVFIKIRSAAEFVFCRECTSEWDKIRKFTSPKLLRLMDIFRLFKPKNQEVAVNSGATNKSGQAASTTRDSTAPNNSDAKIVHSIEIDENFANKVIVDDDIIKVYLDKESNGAIDKHCVESCDMSSSQKVISESHLLPNSQIKSEHLINQLDSCDFQVLQHRLQAECVKFTDTSVCGEYGAGECDKLDTNNKIETSDAVTPTEEHSTNKNKPNLINGCENNTINYSSAGADKEVSCETIDVVTPGGSDESSSKGAVQDLREAGMPSSTPHKSVTFHVDNEGHFKETNNVLVDDICYTKGAFETMMQSNAGLFKVGEKPANNSGDYQASNVSGHAKENHSLETCVDVTKQHIESYNCRMSPKKKLNDAGAKKGRREHRPHNWNDPDSLCGLIFVDEPLMAKILYSLIYEYTRQDPELQFINAQFTVDKTADPQVEPKEAENEHKLQEEVLRRFRTHECNLLIGTSVLEDGMDLPKCNLVIRWDPPRGYRCYAQCRSRARAPKSLYALMAPEHPEKLVTVLAHYTYIERMLVCKCRWTEPGPTEEARATDFTPLILPYRPVQQAVTLSQAVQLVNRYCAKLPSDTFTRLVPLWTIEEITYRGHTLFVCSVRLPINSPMKYQIVGHPMPSKVLARRVAALQVCRALHLSGELDDNLLPIGKESFRALEPDWVHMSPHPDNAQLNTDEPRPGTTKRKQYYYKRVAQSLTGCRPKLARPCLAYEIRCHLAVPLPERHNTRGRKLHPPENYPEGFCILTSKPIHEIPVFPLFTRSGEVQVQLVKVSVQVVMNRRRYKLIHRFMKYTFKEVLRIHNHLMVFNPAKGRKNNYYVVPTTKVTNTDGTSNVIIDWEFLELIYEHTTINNKNMLLHNHSTMSMLEPVDEKPCENAEEVIKNIPDDTCNTADVVESDTQVLEKLETTSELIPMDQNVAATSKPALDILNNIEDIKPDTKDNVQEPDENSTEVSESNDKAKTHLPVSVTDGKLVKLEDLGEDLLEDTWKGQENKVSSVKWDEIDENENASADDKKILSQDCVSVAEEPEEMPNPYLAPGQVFQFDFEKYRDAVVTPWYRNQNQPQYFYVAEICWHLTPQSAFPSSAHPSFMHYYHTKYGVTITQVKQPLLDVDHTSARLNLLTPRFVNRKGVALPTSSERTKRAKRELLEQKQILVPELCCSHPFRGALWRAAVTLPCVLYRINSLLLADEIRRSVAVRVSLGKAHSNASTWPPLDFGWSLADVLKDKVDSLQLKEQTSDGTASLKEVDGSLSNEGKTLPTPDEMDSRENKKNDLKSIEEASGDCDGETTADKVSGKDNLNESGDLFEVGTWSNEMASTIQVDDDLYSKLPANVTMCPSNTDDSIWNSTIPQGGSIYNQTRQRKFSVAGSDISYVSSDMDMSIEEPYSEEEDDVDHKEQEKGGIRIEFKSGNEAEAIDVPPSIEELAPEDQDDLEAKKLQDEASLNAFNGFFYEQDTGDDDPNMKAYIENYQLAIMSNEEDIVKNGTLVKYTDALTNIKLKDYSENIPFYTPKHDSHKHINKRIDYLVHNVRNNIVKVEDSDNGLPKVADNKIPDVHTKCESQSPSCLDRVSNKKECELGAQVNTVKAESNSPDSVKEKWQHMDAQKCDEDLTNPFPDIYEKALSKKEILNLFQDMFPYENKPSDYDFEDEPNNDYLLKAGGIDLEDLEDNKRRILNEIKVSMPKEEWRKYNFFAMKDFHKDETFENDYEDIRAKTRLEKSLRETTTNVEPEPSQGHVETAKSFTFDFQPDLKKHPGPSPSVILQALTMSNANDGINLERLETVGDSFLKYAVTVYLYCSYPNIHEGKLSYLRSKQVSNLNLYRLGRRRHLGSRMVACKFEPHDNWLPPCHKVPAHLERALIHTHIPSSLWNVADMPSLHRMSKQEVEQLVYERVMQHHIKSGDESKESFASSGDPVMKMNDLCPTHGKINQDKKGTEESNWAECLCPVVEEGHLPGAVTRELDHSLEEVPCFVPYNLITQHSIPDKSIADCVEALIGAYLIECGPRGALLFMAWLGMKVLPKHEVLLDPSNPFVKMMEEALVRNKKGCKDKNEKTRTKCFDNILQETKKEQESLDDNEKDLSRVVSEISSNVPCAKEKTQPSSNENSDKKTDLIKKKSKKKKRKNKTLATEVSDQNIVRNVQNGMEDDKHSRKLPRKRRKGKKETAVENNVACVFAVTNQQNNKENSKNKSSNDVTHDETEVKNDWQLDIDDCDDDEGVPNHSDDGFESTEDEEEEEDSSVNSCGEESDWSSLESDVEDVWCSEDNEPGTLLPYKNKNGQWVQVIFGELEAPPSPLLRYVPDPDGELTQMLSGYEELERTLNYRFNDRCYLLQAMTHASHTHNRLTDCYQRLEFLGDAVLDYLITRQLYEDPRRHSPGPLTDLRSALVNNTIFASLAVRHGMHKFFRHLSPGLNEVLARFVKIQEENGHSISEEHYLIQEDECEQAEDVEVPKALGDLFESVAGAIFLDSGMSLDAVWKVYYALMHKEMELFSETVPKSPVRELLEMEPETTKFGKPEKLADGRRVRVTVEVLGVGAFKGVGRNFRIAKCTAAKCALRHLNLLKGNTSGAKTNIRK